MILLNQAKIGDDPSQAHNTADTFITEVVFESLLKHNIGVSSDNAGTSILQCLDNPTDYGKRKIINSMFALNGYSFATAEWQNYFSRYSWYKPN